MRKITLQIDDNIYDHILFLLDGFKTKGVVIEKNEKQDMIDFSKYNIDSLKQIDDPVQWQNEIREEWDRE